MLSFVRLFGVNIDSGFFFWGIGIVAAQIYYQTVGKKYGFKWYQSLILGFSFLIFEMIGAKILYIAENFDYVLENGIHLSGFSFFGIMFSVPALVWVLSKCIRVSCGKLLDFASVGILLELAFYRIGCTCVGCCGGIMYGNIQIPVQPIEAVLDSVLAVALMVLYAKRKRKSGEQYLLYMSGYGIIRFILEFMRERKILFVGMSLSHIWALLTVTIGMVIIVRRRGSVKCEKRN